MLEAYFTYPAVLRRLRSGALGAEMDRIAGHFRDLGYKPASAKAYLSRIGQFSDFVARKGRSPTIDMDTMNCFLRSLRTAPPRAAARSAISHARRVVPERFSATCDPPPHPHQALLDAYLDYLREVRGLAPKSCEGLRLTACRVLDWHDRLVPSRPLNTMTGQHVFALVMHLLSLSANQQTRSATTSHIRTFLHFLRWSGQVDDDLARFVPRTLCWRLAHLPPRIAWNDVRRAIDAINPTSSSDMRDRAILLLLATTGMRNRELRSLELHDIRWRSAEVLIRQTKSGRDRVVPLVQEAGAALAQYVLHGRPKVSSRHVFLSHVAPVGPFRSSSPVSRLVRSRLERCGVALPRSAGAHLVRHSLATQLVAQRRPINEVADLLGHSSIDTTAIYIKVALPQLANVALPFPGGVS